MRSNPSIPPSTVAPVLVYPDVRAAGARAVDPLTGERQYTAADPWGHRWTFAETLDDVAPGDWSGTTVAG